MEAYDGSGAKFGNKPSLAPGQQVHVLAAGFQSSEPVSLTLHSTPRSLGTAVASSAGVLTYTLAIPADLPEGAHLLRMAGSDLTTDFTFVVRRPATPAVPGAGGTTGSLPLTGINTVPLLLLGATLVATGVLLLRTGSFKTAGIASGRIPTLRPARRGKHAR